MSFIQVGPGLHKELVAAGDGTTIPTEGSDVYVHFTCVLTGSRAHVDSSRGTYPNTVGGITVLKQKQPFRFKVGGGSVIPGWDLAVPTMSLGERATFRLCPELGYGKAGKGSTVPPDAELEYDMELVGVDGKFYISKN